MMLLRRQRGVCSDGVGGAVPWAIGAVARCPVCRRTDHEAGRTTVAAPSTVGYRMDRLIGVEVEVELVETLDDVGRLVRRLGLPAR